jgi:hypothetical protein
MQGPNGLYWVEVSRREVLKRRALLAWAAITEVLAGRWNNARRLFRDAVVRPI